MNDTNFTDATTTATDRSLRYDSATDTAGTATTGDDRHAIATYVSDILALERHIREPLQRQTELDETTNYADALGVITQIERMTENHIAALEAQLDRVGGHAGSPVKSAWSSRLGVGAAAIDSVRKTKVSKSLRDDSTALALASISYTMLHTTALGLGDESTAALAKRHLDDTARLTMEITRVIPGVVLQELADDGENVTQAVRERALADARDSWHQRQPQ